MPRPRKPTALLELSGAFIHDPQRRASRACEPTPDPAIGNAPSHLSKVQKKIWHELMSEIPPQVATRADRKVIEVATRMVEKMRHVHTWAIESGNGSKVCPDCPGEMRSSDYATLNRCLSQLGMTPADRSKIRVAPAPKVDDWEGFD